MHFYLRILNFSAKCQQALKVSITHPREVQNMCKFFQKLEIVQYPQEDHLCSFYYLWYIQAFGYVSEESENMKI